MKRDELIADVSAASAAYLFNALPSIVSLPAAEAFDRLRVHFETAFLALFDAVEGWGVPVPSAN